MQLTHLVCNEDPVTRGLLWGGAALGVSVVAVYIYKRTRARCFLTPNAPANTVILHQLPRGPYAPNYVPFAIKLETYLRVANIPYQVVPSFQKSPKGKIPWIEYNGEVVSDSAFCIQYLNKKLDVNLNKGLTDRDLGVGKAMERMVEEHLYWFYLSFPWVLETEINQMPKHLNINRVLVCMVERAMKKRTMVQGIGRHTKEEITQAMEENLKALSDILGQKKFFFGDQVTEADCCIFGQLAEFRWHMSGHTPEQILCEKYPNLRDYCDRMKTAYWPDWDECITHGGTRKATK